MSQTMLTITGNVTQAPKICYGKKRGEPFAVLKVAVNNQRFDQETQQWLNTDTTFYELICFGAIGASAMASIRSGDPVVAMGKFKVNAWEGDTYKAQTPTLTVEHLGPDLRFGTAEFARGRTTYATDRTDEEVDFRELAESRMAEDDAEAQAEVDIPADADGVVSDQAAEDYLAASA